MSGRGGGHSGLAVQPTNMTSGRQQRQDELQGDPVKANQAPIHQGLEGYKQQQPPQQQQQQQPQQQQQQRGQAAKAVDYICEVCRKPAMFVCSACKGVAYCSTECQVSQSTRGMVWVIWKCNLDIYTAPNRKLSRRNQLIHGRSVKTESIDRQSQFVSCQGQTPWTPLEL